MLPFVNVVECPREETLLGKVGYTLVGAGIANDAHQRALLDCTDIDRLNLGAVPTV